GDDDHSVGAVYLLSGGGAGGGNLAPAAGAGDRPGTRRCPVAGLRPAGRGGGAFLALAFAGADGARVVGGGQYLSQKDDAGGRGQYSSGARSEEHTSELQSRENLVCRLLLEKKNNQHI